jgi:hypothetical protein
MDAVAISFGEWVSVQHARLSKKRKANVRYDI